MAPQQQSMARANLRITFLALMCCASSLARADAVDSAIAESIRNEALPKWRSIASRFHLTPLDIRASTTLRDLTRDGLPREELTSFDVCLNARDNRNLVKAIYRSGTMTRTRFTGTNDRYAFEVFRDNANQFVLSNGRMNSDEPPNRAYLVDYKNFEWYCLAGIYAWWDVPLADLFSSPKFALLALTRIGENANRRVHVEAVYHGHDLGRRDGWVFWADVDPHHDWLVSQCGVRISESQDKLDYIASLEYSGKVTADLQFIPSSLTRVRRNNLTHVEDRLTVCIDVVERSARPVEEFYLPFYGLSETSLAARMPPRSRHRYLLLGLACAGLLLAALLRRASVRLARLREEKTGQ